MKPVEPSSERRSPEKDSPAVPRIGWSSEEKPREDFEPRYLDIPVKRRGSSGTRNLILGVVILVIALAVMGQALSLLGLRAALPLATALLTVVALFVLARSRVLRQRNGGFVSLAVVCLLGALVALADYAGNRIGGGSVRGEPLSSQTAGKTARSSEDLPLLTQSYEIRTAGENSARFKVLRDLQVVIDERTHLIKAGEIFPVDESGDGEVRFTAGNQQIGLPMNFVEMINPATDTPGQPASGEPGIAATTPGTDPATSDRPATEDLGPDVMAASPMPADESPSQITQRAQKEAIRRYPALGQKDSPENQLFVATYQELKHTGAEDFFADPQWPIQLAELLAKRENWLKQE